MDLAELAERVADIIGAVSKEKPPPFRFPPTETEKTTKNEEPIFFISHDHSDGDFAELLKLRLEKKGYGAWVDLERLRVGEDWRQEIDNAIRNATALVVIMSPEARQSEYVTYEWAFAWGVGVPVIPILLKETPLHPRLESLQYLDFTNRAARPWDKLIDALKKAISKKKGLDD
ncbi:MAG TPA: toll/interleukin-1 receptor domain-containing protein [Anaerolineales bacterium]|nr:toll/interleukin-1 receptor domain-containing protein [Anaerolineales bacterium]